jgi:hypothetical protein
MRPAHCMALTSAAARVTGAHALRAGTRLTHTDHNVAPAQQIFCSARPLGCVSAAQCRSERSTALLLLALEDS